MFNIMAQYAGRIASSRERLRQAWMGTNDRPVLILSDVNYALCGQTDIPDDYWEPAVMFAYQRDKIRRHMAEIPDDYIPVFHPWYGTTVVPSAMGAKVRLQKGLDPAVDGVVLNEPEDVARLTLPDPERDGQMPQVLACLDYFRANTDAPVCVTDCQSPLAIAVSLAGAENLFVWLYEAPAAVHQLMELCTQALIDWIKVQKKRLGHGLCADAYPHAIELPAGYGGVAFSDDDMTSLSPAHYETFVKPYNQRLLAAFGGGSLHFCGSARHQIDNLLHTEGCTGLNNFSMCDYEQARMLRDGFLGRGAVMACDFNASDVEAHCRALRETWADGRGVVCGVFVAPTMALSGGKYVTSAQTRNEVVARYLDGLKDWLH